MRVRLGSSVLAAMAIAGALSACGSSSKTISKADFIKRADAICASGNQRIRALPQPNLNPSKVTTAQLPQLASFLGQFLMVLQSEYDQIVALPSPSSDKSTIDQALASVKQSIGVFAQMRQRAMAGDVAGFKTLFAQENGPGSANNRANALAKQFGLKVCGQG
jgi:hypothetical protein